MTTVKLKASCNIATYPPRINSLRKMLASVYPQFDIIRIYLNQYDKIPVLSDPDKKIQYMRGTNLYDNGKFAGLDSMLNHEIYYCCDDDIVYPPDYRQVTDQAIAKYGCIVTYHGRRLLTTGVNYYTSHQAFRCLDNVYGNIIMDVAGTGVTAFDTRYFFPKWLSTNPNVRMSDLIFSLEAAKNKKMIGMIEHRAGWIQHIDNKETIFDTESKGKLIAQNEIADEIFRINHKQGS